MLDNGSIIEGTVNLVKHGTDYYKNLFGPAPDNLFPILIKTYRILRRNLMMMMFTMTLGETFF
jgi:hypothetical protein